MNGMPELAKPAQRALDKSGVTHLEQLAEMTELEVGQLRGIGSGARRQLREGLAAKGLAFAVAKKEKPAKGD